MAIDPKELAEEQTQRAALAAQGAPDEFAKDPALSTQLAGGSTRALMEVLNRIKPSPTDTVPSVDAPFGAVPPGETSTSVAARVPTPQEVGLVPQDGTYSQRATQEVLADQVLSEEGAQQFRDQNLQAKPDPGAEVLVDAQQAIDEELAAAQQEFVDVNEKAKRSLTAEQQGFKPETAVVDEEAADEVLRVLDERAAGVQSIVDASAADGSDFNFDYMNTTGAIEETINALSEIYKDPTKVLKRGFIPNNMTVNEAAQILADEAGFTRQLLMRKEGEGLNAETLVAARELLVRSADKLEKLATKIRTGQGSDLDRLAFRRQMSIHAGIQMQIKGAQTEAGRALQSFQITVGGEQSAVRQAQEARRMLMESGGVELTDDMAEKFLEVMAEKGMKGANEFARGGWRAKTRKILGEAYLAGLLSNPATQVKNIVGTAGFMLYQLPAEMIGGMYGATIRKGRAALGRGYPISEDQVYVNDALMRFKGWMDSYKDAIRVGAIAFKTEVPVGSSKLDVETYTAIQGESDSFFARSISELGKRARYSFRLLLAGDEFFKTISQRGELYVKANHAYQHAIRNGETVEQAQDKAGMVLLDPGSIAEELDVKAKYDTLQSDLGWFGKATGRLQQVDVAGIPIGRIVMPFATAPTNSVMRSAEFVPLLNFATPNGFNDLVGRNGPRAQQMAMGRLTLGSATMAVVANYALEGAITGSLPSDPKIRDALPPNWQPYSFVLRGEGFPEDKPLYDTFGRPNGPLIYVSYAGYEPVGAIIGITADTIQRMFLTRDPEMRQNLAAAAVAATGHYYKEASMLQGMADVMNVFDTGDVTKILRGPAEAATIANVSGVGFPNPFSSLQRAGGKIIDPGVTQPREDKQYYTEADILAKNEDGTFVHALPDGTPNYYMVGTPKGGMTAISDFFQELDAYQAKDSISGDEYDKNAPRYDTLGNQLGAQDISLATNPKLAIFNNLSGVRMRFGEKVPDYQSELMRLAAMTGGWPLSNPDSKEGIRLGNGAISDWVNLSKNVVTIRMPGLGEVTFKDALDYMLVDTSNSYGRRYEKSEDKVRVSMIRDLNKEFLNAGWAALLEDERYANIKQAYNDILILKEEGKR